MIFKKNTPFIAIDFALKQAETNKRNGQSYHSVNKLLNTTQTKVILSTIDAYYDSSNRW